MKKSDWALIIMVVLGVAVVSYFVVGAILPPPQEESVKTVPAISASIIAPDNNIILYDEDRPSWCPKGSADSSSSSSTDTTNTASNTDTNTTNTTDNSSSTSSNKQFVYINSVFNSCAINSSFTTKTE